MKDLAEKRLILKVTGWIVRRKCEDIKLSDSIQPWWLGGRAFAS